MKKRRNILILILALIIITSILIIFILINNQRSKYGNEFEKNADESNVQIKYEYEKVDSASLFYTVSDCIQSYYDYISLDIESQNDDNKQLESVTFTEMDKKEAIYSVLDKEYIDKKGISLDNLYNFVTEVKGNVKFIPVKMNMLDNGKVQKFCVYGIILKEGNIIYSYIIVNLDYYNMTYSIEPIEENKYKDINEIELINEKDKIEVNEYNSYIYNRMSEEDLMSKYIYYYKITSLFDINTGYNLLNEEYREKKFGNIENYKAYVENNKDQIYASILQSYQIKEDGDKTRYICLDQYGNYYIFTENSIMDYSVILDTYTIDLPEFTEKYNSATDGQKVAMNIDKFIKAINDKDYKYAYNCLADSFKNNYFKTQEEFENYAKQNFYENNSVEYQEFDTNGEYYTYSVTLTNKDNDEQKNKTFVMKLGEETKFEMSFDR